MKSLKGLIASILLLLSLTINAQTIPPVVSAKYLKTLTSVPSTFTVTENEMFTEVTAGPPIPFKDKLVTNYVKLAIDPGKDDFITGVQEYKVDVEIKVWNVDATFTSFTTSTFTKTLIVDYKADNSTKFTDLNLYNFNDAYKVQVKVTQVYLNGTAYTSYSSLPNSLYIEAGIEIERYYDFDPTFEPADLEVVYDEDYQYINIQNFDVPGAVAYDIEWTYVNNYSDVYATDLPASALNFSFHNNSSRIRVYSDEIIKIPAVFDKGYVVVRARGIGRTGTNLDEDWYGDWSILDHYDNGDEDPILLSTISATTYLIEIGASPTQPVFESNKNWMYQVTFAEEGKMKHVISYFDGTSRNRQSVTVVNTENEAIVAETFYDHQGRAVVQSLPVPVDRDLVGSDYIPNKHLNYFENFNLSSEGTSVKFGKLDFDIDAETTYCTTTQNPFSTVSGSGKYYSPDNQIQNKHNGFIPDAEGYAYTLTEFMPDNTGRVRRQTGVGPNHNFESEHYTSYFYGKPFQEELDRLFGTNVGDAAHYQKNMIVDPNGQVSISYLDMKGNVIATALAGEAPTNVQSLKVDGTGDDVFDAVVTENTIDLLDKSLLEPHGSSNELSEDGMSYSLYSPILVTSASDYTFLYSVGEKEYLEECLSAICFDCVYDIDITLLDLCGNPAGGDGLDVHQTIGDEPLIDGSDSSLLCEVLGEFELTGADMLAENIPTGIYYLNKNLSINTNALETYANLYIAEMQAIANPEVDVYSAELDGAGSDGIEDALQDADHDGIYGEEINCFQSFEEFYYSALQNVDISDCDISCEDCAIVQGQSEAEFITAHAVSETPEESAALAESYYEALAFCDAMCSSPGNDFCLMAKNMMLADMSPGGQYAKYFNDAEGTIDPTIDPISILNEGNVLQHREFVEGATTDWRNPVRFIDGDWVFGYFNEDGTELTKLLVTGIGPDMSPATIAPFTGLDGYTYTYPEDLTDVETFIELFEPSWASSLIAYHPEYYYYEDCLELYTPDEDIEITGTDLPDCNDCNSYQFDEYLLNLIYDEDLVGSSIDDPTAYDPFFIDNYTSGEKTDFINRFINGDDGTYGECDFSIYQFAWLSAHTTPAFYDLVDCADVEDEIELLGGTTSWELMADEIAWKNFVLTYISAKYQFWLEYADAAVDEKNGYHGCIGVDYNYQYASNVVTPFDDIEELWSENYVCGLPQGLRMSEKVSRFPDIEQLYGIDEDDLAGDLDVLLSDADVAYFEATGNEPIAFDLELFLNGLLSVAGGWTPVESFDIISNLALTPRLYTELNDLGLGTWNPTFTDITETSIQWGTGPCLTLTLPDGTHAFEDILSLHDIHVTDAAGGEFEIIANFAPVYPATDEEEVTLTGVYCGSLDASPFPTTNCQLSPEATAVWSVMNAILAHDLVVPTDNFHTTTATSINTIAGYDISTGIMAQMQPYLGETLPYKWKYDATSEYFSLLSNDGTQSVNIYFITDIAVGTDYLYLMEPLAEPEFAGITNDFTIVSIDGATELGFAGYMTWKWESETYTFPVAECDFAVELFCNDKENLNRVDLEALFTALIDDENFTPAIGSPVSLETYAEYTDNLEVLTGHPVLADYWAVTSIDEHVMHTAFKSYEPSIGEYIPNCTAEFNIEDATITDLIDDADFGELISLTGNYDYTFSDYTYNFILEIETTEAETLFVQGTTTCTPIKDCDDCHEEITDIYEDYTPSIVIVDHTVTAGVSTVGVDVVVAGGATDVASVSGTTTFTTIKGIGNNRAYRQDTVDVVANTTKTFMMYARYVNTIIDTLYKQIAGGNMKVITRLGDLPPARTSYTADEDCIDNYKAYPLVESENDCIDQQLTLAYANALDAYNNYILELKGVFKDNYVSHCMSALETFTMQYQAGEYHYTLYYYDQADNVVMTVPPKGVNFVDESYFEDIDDYRDNVLAAAPVPAMHTLTTRYAYNSLNQLKWQSTPDGGESEFWYDYLGRMVLSQNAKQNKIYEDFEDDDFEKYSYTSYDNLSRIEQVGELWATPNLEDHPVDGADPIDFDEEINNVDFPSAIIAAYRYEVTRTNYDVALDLTIDPPFGAVGQQNLRKRIASVYYEDTYDGNNNTYNHATHYSYDIHGNVHTIIQDNPNLTGLNEQFKTMKYAFDLISGNVNKVSYQDGDVDRFYHKYLYDADNRINEVYTSRDNIIWERDARYFYYRHGPLARAEIGDLIVQGVDYAYTIHGWLKGVNAGALNATRDMGGDGQGSSYRKNIGLDAFGFILDYYEGDYAQINSGTNSFIPAVGTSGFSDVTASLFNGNIRAMTTAIMETTVTYNKHVIAPTLGKAYRYDQLNRLTESLSYEKSTMHQTGQFTWAGVSSTNKWATKYAYDANGNILDMFRAGNLGGAYDMDSLNYFYNTNNNQLKYVTDDVAGTVYADVDVDNQDIDNYIYDEIGNMVSDDQGEINEIVWNVYGKIKSIDKLTGPDLEFAYDVTGNRIMKKVTESGQPTKTTYYARDAQGNVMAVYTRQTTTGGSPTDSLFLSEQHIYGSSRLGYVQTKVTMTSSIPTTGYYSRVLGEKAYELSNHLENVLATVSDRRFAVEGSGATAGKINNFEPDVLSSQDYDPFGMITFGRSWEVGSGYRYGFNGKENEDDIAGNDNAIDFGARIYDSRLARWWGIDKATINHSNISPYVYTFNSPIYYLDPDGNDPIEAGKSLFVNVSFFAYDFIGTDHPSPTKFATINDYELFQEMDAWNTMLVLGGFVGGVIPKGLDDIFNGIAQDYGFSGLADHVEALLDATFSDTYSLDNFEYGPEYDINKRVNLPNKYNHRIVQNLGEGFEAMVTYKEEYWLTYSKDDKGKNVMNKTIHASYIYTAPIINSNYGKEGTSFKDFKYIQTQTKIIYNADGTSTTESKTIGLNPTKNTKTCKICE